MTETRPKVFPIRPSRALERFRWMAEVLASPLYTPADKCILMRLALHQNVETGRLFVSADRLARGTSLSERQAQRTIKKAGLLGSVTWTASTGRGKANHYNLKNTTPESYLSEKYDSGVAETAPKVRLGSRTNREDITGNPAAPQNRPSVAELAAKHPDLLKRFLEAKPKEAIDDGASGKNP